MDQVLVAAGDGDILAVVKFVYSLTDTPKLSQKTMDDGDGGHRGLAFRDLLLSIGIMRTLKIGMVLVGA